jgi:hypothetical protein
MKLQFSPQLHREAILKELESNMALLPGNHEGQSSTLRCPSPSMSLPLMIDAYK